MTSKFLFAAAILGAVAAAPLAHARSDLIKERQYEQERLAGDENQFELTEPGRVYIACVLEVGVDAAEELCWEEIEDLLGFNAKAMGLQQYEILPLQIGARKYLRRTTSRYIRRNY